MLASGFTHYVNDAFGAAHRAHASTEAVARRLPSYAGLLLAREVEVMEGLLRDPASPFVAILGGAKVSDKLPLIESLLNICDRILIGGAMCFTFLAALGDPVGRSRHEGPEAQAMARSGMIRDQSSKTEFMIFSKGITKPLTATGQRALTMVSSGTTTSSTR